MRSPSFRLARPQAFETRFGRVADEDALLCSPGVDKVGHDVPGLFVLRGRGLGELVNAAVDIGVDRPVVLIQRVDDLGRLLGAGGAVKKCQRLAPIDQRLVQNREVFANLCSIQRRYHL
jgi:hypothetical protein